jgi:GNAT superfamily N-acetyltransferase
MPEPVSGVIRPAVAGDAAAIAPLLGQLGYPTGSEAVAPRLGRLLDSADTGAVVAELQERVIGLATYQLTELIYRPLPQCRLTALVVDARYRRRGVARQLVAEIESIARASGCFRIEVMTQPSSGDALGLYATLGFEPRPVRLVKVLPSA